MRSSCDADRMARIETAMSLRKGVCRTGGQSIRGSRTSGPASGLRWLGRGPQGLADALELNGRRKALAVREDQECRRFVLRISRAGDDGAAGGSGQGVPAVAIGTHIGRRRAVSNTGAGDLPRI